MGEKRQLPIAGDAGPTVEAPPRPEGFRLGAALSDPQGRRYRYLRLSLTDRCNFACIYCMPPDGERGHALRPDLLSFEEILRLVSVFAAGGVRRVRFTGGEPLVRRDAVRLVEMVGRCEGIDELVMTTNGSRLTELARPLADAGLAGVNVSIDSLDPERFAAVTRGGDLGPVLAGIDAALEAGMEVKINVVAIGGVNDDELGALVDYAWSVGATPRVIEVMPIGEAADLPAHRFLSVREVLERLGDRVDAGAPLEADGGRGPARYVPARDGSGRRVGVIAAVSDEFCATCNRVRVTARGDMRACLASRRAVSLRDVMRRGGDDDTLAWAIAWSLGSKEAGHRFTDAGEAEHRRVGMSLVGG